MINCLEYLWKKKINLTKELEKEAMSLDKRVVSVQMCGYEEFEESRTIVNTKGVDLSNRVNGGVLYIAVVVKEREDTKTAMAFKTFKDLYKDIPLERSGYLSTELDNASHLDMLEFYDEHKQSL